jgi:hypothetical protein
MSQALTEWEAAHAANLDLSLWDSGGYSGKFMAKVLAWYQRHRELDMHRQDAQARALERMQKKRG